MPPLLYKAVFFSLTLAIFVSVGAGCESQYSAVNRTRSGVDGSGKTTSRGDVIFNNRLRVTDVKYRKTGALTQVQVFGRKAFGVGKITGGSQGVIVLQGATKSDPLNMVTTVGWKSIFQPRALTAPHCVSIYCGATGL